MKTKHLLKSAFLFTSAFFTLEGFTQQTSPFVVYGETNAVMRVESSVGPNNTSGVELMPWKARTGGAPVKLVGIDDASYSAHLGIFTAQPNSVASTAIERMRVTSSGNIGIGTSDPKTILHVQGKGSFGDKVTVDNAKRALNLVSTDAVMRIVRVHPTYAPAVELISRTSEAEGGDLAYWDFYAQPTDGSFRIRDRKGGGDGIDMIKISSATGNVGIGTNDTKGYKLAVAGSAGIVAEKIVIKQKMNWPDYVFNENYNLSSLTDLESYIKKYKHLPEVPSAKEVEEGGLDLAKTQAALLKKIEELSLYVIEQDKKNQKLQQRIEQLENKQ